MKDISPFCVPYEPAINGTESEYKQDHLTRPLCGAQIDDGEFVMHCPKVPKTFCKFCKLVSYCSEKCKNKDWASHEPKCAARSPNWKPPKESVDKLPDPNFFQLFWCRSPARDIMNLQNNEGLDFSGLLRLFFFPPSGLRHFIYSMVKLPSEPACGIKAVFNEPAHPGLVRTLLSIFLITAHNEDPFVNAEALVHIFYSLKIPARALQHIRRVTESVLNKAKKHVLERRRVEPERLSIPLNFTRGRAELCLDFRFTEWMQVFSILRCSTYGGYEKDRNMELRTSPEMSEATRSNYPPGREACARRWEEDGLLLPYAHPRSSYSEPNPVFTSNQSRYPFGSSSEPLVEWPREELLGYNHPLAHQGSVLPPNDVYGKMFYYVRDMCVLCQYRLRDVPVHFDLLSMPEGDVPGYCNERGWGFDRIEVGELFDQAQFNTMTMVSGMLCYSSVNPYARVLAVSRLALEPPNYYAGVDAIYQNKLHSLEAIIQRLAPVVDLGDLRLTAARRHLFLMMHLRDWDKESNEYLSTPLSEPELSEPYGPDRLYECLYGLKLESKNIIVPRWDDRPINPESGTLLTLQDFNRLIGWPDSSARRWLEWSKTRCMEFRELEIWISASTKYQTAYFSRNTAALLKYEQYLQEMVTSRFQSLLIKMAAQSEASQNEEVIVNKDPKQKEYSQDAGGTKNESRIAMKDIKTRETDSGDVKVSVSGPTKESREGNERGARGGITERVGIRNKRLDSLFVQKR